MDFSVNYHDSSIEQELSADEQINKEKQLRFLLENASERVRLLYFQEEFEEDLKNEQVITVEYDETKMINSESLGLIEFDRIIVFLSGRLKSDLEAEYATVLTTNGGEISIWNCHELRR